MSLKACAGEGMFPFLSNKRMSSLSPAPVIDGLTDLHMHLTSAGTKVASGRAMRCDGLQSSSYGADGMVTRSAIGSIKDLKGKTVAASAPGTSPYFALAWFLKENGMSVKDVTVVNMEPGPAAQAFIAGQNDAALTYEPYLSAVREKPDAGKIIATTLDYPMVMDTFGCTPAFLAANDTAAAALTKSYFEALDLIKADKDKAFGIMGADVKQTGEQFGKSAGFLRWSDAAGNKAFFSGEWQAFSAKAADLLLEIGLIKAKPDLKDLVETKYVAGK